VVGGGEFLNSFDLKKIKYDFLGGKKWSSFDVFRKNRIE
jgi:hypothetical protein